MDSDDPRTLVARLDELLSEMRALRTESKRHTEQLEMLEAMATAS